MAEIWKPQSIDVYVSWVTSVLIEASDKLNDWEVDFIENIQLKLSNGQELSKAQAEKLEQIYTKHTS